MKKAVLSFFVFAASAVYVVYQYFGGNTVSATVADTPAPQPIASTQGQESQAQGQTSPAQTTPTKTQPTPVSTPVPTPTQAPAPTPTPTPTPVTKPKGQYADGTYTGSVADAYYGNVQVQVSVQGGKIASVTFLQYPNDRSTSRYINSQAMPLLEQEAIQAQSANVSGVSGASDTSMAFVQSLSDALSKAKNA